MKRFIKLLGIICIVFIMLDPIEGNTTIVSDDFNDNDTSYLWSPLNTTATL